MKAMVYTQYGSPDVLQLKEVEKPTPKFGTNAILDDQELRDVVAYLQASR